MELAEAKGVSTETNKHNDNQNLIFVEVRERKGLEAKKHMLKENVFHYDLCEGTKHYVLWFSYDYFEDKENHRANEREKAEVCHVVLRETSTFSSSRYHRRYEYEYQCK